MQASYPKAEKPANWLELVAEPVVQRCFGVVEVGEHDVDDDTFSIDASPTASATKTFSWGLGLNWHLNRIVKVNLSHDQTDFKGGAATDLLARGEKGDLHTRSNLVLNLFHHEPEAAA